MWQHRPLVVACAGFVVGIIVAAIIGGPAVVYASISCAGLAWLILDPKRAGVAAAVAAIGVGAFRCEMYLVRQANDISGFSPAAQVVLRGTIDGEPTAHHNSIAFILQCDRVTTEGRTLNTSGRAWVTAGVLAGQNAPVLHDGDRVTLAASLDAPRPASNPGGFSWGGYLADRAIWTEAHTRRASAITAASHSHVSSLGDFALSIRARLLAGLARTLSRRNDAVLTGVLFGLRAEIPPGILNAFVATGTVHILATAGLHVGIIVLLLRWITHLIGAPLKVSALTSIGLLLMYDLMAGGRPAVTRAVIVAVIYLAATIFERAPEVLTSVAAAAVGILYVQPTALMEPGFQMSFLTVLTLVALLPVWRHLWDPWLETMRWKARWASGKAVDLVGMCIFAQMGAVPIVANEFHILPLWSVVANLIVVPQVFLLIPSGLVTAVLSAVWPAGASILAKVTVSPLIGGIVWVTHQFGSAPGSSVAVGEIPAWLIAAYYILLCGGGFVWQQKMVSAKRKALHAHAGDGDPVVVRTA